MFPPRGGVSRVAAALGSLLAGLIVASTRSGAGKTTLTIGLIAALRARGIEVAAAKSGPDYIDPAFHAAASGTPSLNLDSWAMPAAVLETLAGSRPGLLVVEAAMGLFDGVDGTGQTGSAADLAARFGLPVLLVLDVSGQSQSAGAVALGFARFRGDVRIGGVVLNRVASERHRAQAAGAIEAAGLPVLGSLMRDPSLALPERHLGLVQARELGDLVSRVTAIGERVARAVDLEAVLAMAETARPIAGGKALGLRPPGQRVAIAHDEAFGFLYPHLLAGWRDSGAELVPFSPLADAAPDPGADALWLPGGYPELHAGRIAANSRFIEGVRGFAGAVHGECGGFMVLGETLEDADGVTHRMTGRLGHATSFARRRLSLGYREAVLLGDCAIGRRGARLRGHEFHYATLTEPGPDEALAELADARGQPLGPAGGRRGLVSGSFFHVIAGGADY